MVTDQAEYKTRHARKLSQAGCLCIGLLLAGCSGDKESAAAKPMADAATTAKDTAKAMEAEAKSAAAEVKAAAPAAAEMPRLAMDDPQAKALSYVEDASSIDSAKQPRYQAGQACANCALYQSKDGAEWAGCSIFPGKLVAAAGWCSVYAAKPA